LNWRKWNEVEGAPHGKMFYGFIALFGALGIVFFCYVAIGDPTDSSLIWRVAYGARAPLYLLGMLQALERLVGPERALRRTAELSEGIKLGILIGRWATLVVSVGGFLIAVIASFYLGPDWQDLCGDLKILTLSMLMLCFCLADLVGETTFSQTMWTTAWQRGATDGIGGLAKKRVSWRSLY
jgi:hypothetical protein